MNEKIELVYEWDDGDKIFVGKNVVVVIKKKVGAVITDKKLAKELLSTVNSIRRLEKEIEYTEMAIASERSSLREIAVKCDNIARKIIWDEDE